VPWHQGKTDDLPLGVPRIPLDGIGPYFQVESAGVHTSQQGYLEGSEESTGVPAIHDLTLWDTRLGQVDLIANQTDGDDVAGTKADGQGLNAGRIWASGGVSSFSHG